MSKWQKTTESADHILEKDKSLENNVNCKIRPNFRRNLLVVLVDIGPIIEGHETEKSEKGRSETSKSFLVNLAVGGAPDNRENVFLGKKRTYLREVRLLERSTNLHMTRPARTTIFAIAGIERRTVETTTCSDFRKLIVRRTRKDRIARTARKSRNSRKILVLTLTDAASKTGRIQEMMDVTTTVKSFD